MEKYLRQNTKTFILLIEIYIYLESDLYVTAKWLVAVSKIKPSSDKLLSPIC
jgi:hypothetical protein